MMEIEVKKPVPTISQLTQAQRRIHSSLDKGDRPSPGDVEIIGGQEALASLLNSRSQMKETINQLTDQEIRQTKENLEKEPLKKINEKSGDTQEDFKEVEKQPHKMSRIERDYYEFVDE